MLCGIVLCVIVCIGFCLLVLVLVVDLGFGCDLRCFTVVGCCSVLWIFLGSSGWVDLVAVGLL